MLSHGQLFINPWTIAHQVPLSIEFSRQEYWSTLPFSPPGGLSQPPGLCGSNTHLLCFVHCRQILYLLSHQESPKEQLTDKM